jgi:hypothetical protein
MPPCLDFHTSEPETSPVYHNNSACFESKRIKRVHRCLGRGVDRRLCEVCADLDRHGR